jgi:hypothetical protein
MMTMHEGKAGGVIAGGDGGDCTFMLHANTHLLMLCALSRPVRASWYALANYFVAGWCVAPSCKKTVHQGGSALFVSWSALGVDAAGW